MGGESSGQSSPGSSDPAVIARLQESIQRRELVAVFGTGVSIGLTDQKNPSLSWRGLIEHGFSYAARKGLITNDQLNRWKPQLSSSDLDELLGAAEFVRRKLDSRNLYGRWLESVFKAVQPSNAALMAAIKGLAEAKVPFCTLNYDTLLERVTELPTISLADTTKAAEWARRELPAVLHLHGSWNEPLTCVLGIRDYDSTQHDEIRALLQRHLGSYRQLLFIGCGDTIGDPNFSSLVEWLREHMKTAALEHYALVPDNEVDLRNRDEAWHGFLEPLGYGPRENLAAFLTENFVARASLEQQKESTRAAAMAFLLRNPDMLKKFHEDLFQDTTTRMMVPGVPKIDADHVRQFQALVERRVTTQETVSQ